MAYSAEQYKQRKGRFEGKTGPCARCKEIKPYFSLNYCRECKREQDNKSARNAIKRNLVCLYQYKCKPCIICNIEYHPAAMQLHHRDRSTKTRPLQAYLNYSTKKFQNELDKCDVVCSNCHAVKTYEETSETSIYYPYEVLREVLKSRGFIPRISSLN